MSAGDADVFLLCRPLSAYKTMSVSREDLLAAAEDDCSERFIGLIAKHVSASLGSICVVQPSYPATVWFLLGMCLSPSHMGFYLKN